MIFDIAGLALQGEQCSSYPVGRLLMLGIGITGGFDYNSRVEYIVPPGEVVKGASVKYIEVSANGVFGVEQDPPRVSLYP